MTTLSRSRLGSGEPPYGPDLVGALDAATAAVHRLAGMVQLLPNAHRLGVAGAQSAAVASCALENRRVHVLDLLRLEAGDGDRLDEGRRTAARRAADGATAIQDAICRARAAGRVEPTLVASLVDRIAGRPGVTRGPLPVRLAKALQALDDPTGPPLVRLAMAQWRLGAPSARTAAERRVGPVLTALGLAASGVLSQPVLRLPEHYATRLEEYRTRLAGSDPMPWVRWYLDAVRAQASDDERWALRLRGVELATTHRLRQRRASGTAVAAAGTLLARPFLSAHTLAGDLGVTLPTARFAITQLVDSGDLVETTARRRSRYYLAAGMLAEVHGQLAGGDGAG